MHRITPYTQWPLEQRDMSVVVFRTFAEVEGQCYEQPLRLAAVATGSVLDRFDELIGAHRARLVDIELREYLGGDGAEAEVVDRLGELQQIQLPVTRSVVCSEDGPNALGGRSSGKSL